MEGLRRPGICPMLMCEEKKRIEGEEDFSCAGYRSCR